MKRSWYLHPIIWGRRDRDALPFIIFIKFLLKLKAPWFSEDATVFSTRRQWDTGCFPRCVVQVQTVGSLPPPLTPVEHCMMLAHPVASLMSLCWSLNSWSCISCISGLRHPVFVNSLCLPITWRKSLWVKENSNLLGLVREGQHQHTEY